MAHLCMMRCWRRESKAALIGRLDDATRAKKAGESEQETFACVTFNNLGYNLSLSDGGNLWEVYDIPYINILMDHPFHYEKPLRLAPKTAAVLCTDRRHVAYLRRYFKNILRTDFLPMRVWGLAADASLFPTAVLMFFMPVRFRSTQLPK